METKKSNEKKTKTRITAEKIQELTGVSLLRIYATANRRMVEDGFESLEEAMDDLLEMVHINPVTDEFID